MSWASKKDLDVFVRPVYDSLYQMLYLWACLLARVDNMKDKDIPKIVKKLRTELGLTQEQFAAKIGVTFSTVNRWENGKGKLSPLAMLRIEDLLKEQNK